MIAPSASSDHESVSEIVRQLHEHGVVEGFLMMSPIDVLLLRSFHRRLLHDFFLVSASIDCGCPSTISCRPRLAQVSAAGRTGTP